MKEPTPIQLLKQYVARRQDYIDRLVAAIESGNTEDSEYAQLSTGIYALDEHIRRLIDELTNASEN